MNARHQQFINEYLSCWNATEAYRRVYPNASDTAAASNGYRLLRNTEIADAISQRLTESAMSADEVLMRLADHARGNIADFTQITPSGPVFDFAKAESANRLHLVKKLKTKTKTYVTGEKDNEELVTEVDVEFELYDAQAALEKLGRHHKLFTDKRESDDTVTIKVVESDDAIDG